MTPTSTPRAPAAVAPGGDGPSTTTRGGGPDGTTGSAADGTAGSPAGGVDLSSIDTGLDAAVRTGLAEIEVALHEVVAGADPSVTAPARHLLDAGGKRFRPTLTLLASYFGDPHAPGVIPSALVVELTHLATLYHDDVMDEASLRRGAPAANRAYGNTVAILTGDYLFAKASETAASLGRDVVMIQARTFSRLVQGQIRETAGVPAGADRLAHYLSVVADKTGSLVGTAAQFGGLLGGAGPEATEVLRVFGEKIGVAFQLADDLLDVVGQGGALGKTPGTDLREGVATLPVLLALADPASTPAPLQAALDEVAAGRALADDRVTEVLRALRGHPAIEASRAVVDRWTSDAREVLTALPDGAARHALDQLARSVGTRSS